MSSRLIRVWAIAAAVVLGVQLGGYPLLDADEGRNAEVAREMAETNDYVVPRLGGMPYLDKPVVYFAAEALAMEVLGATELAARLPAYLFTLLTAWLVAWFARRLDPDRAEVPWIAAAIFLTIPLTVAFARTVIFDSALSFFIVASIVAFYVAIEEGSRRAATIAWLAIGFGILTKGPVALVVPLLVAIPYAIRRKRFRAIGSIAGILGAIAIVAPWVWAVSREVPDFLHYVLVTETAARLATSELQRTGPPWYFVPYLIGGALPWSIAAFFALRRKADHATLFLLLWVAVPFLFFSLSQSKRPQYILPMMPAVALLAARLDDEKRRAIATRIAGAMALAFGAILLAAPLVIHRTKMKPVVAAAVDDVAIPLGICAFTGGLAALAWARRREIAMVALALPVMALPLVADPLLEAIAERRSTRSFVAQMRPHLAPGTEVVGIEAFTGSLAFYLGRTFVVVTPDASEFTSNYLLRRYDRFVDRPGSSIRSPAWLRKTLDDTAAPRLFVVRNDDRAWRAELEARGRRLVATGAHHVAYR